MGSPETINSARNLAVMVRVQGPDPKGLKMRSHAFHHYHSGRTTLSASGMLLPRSLYDSDTAKDISVPAVQIDIMFEKGMWLENDSEDLGKGASRWHAAKCLKLIDVPASARALQSLVEASFGSVEHGWEVGWSLASLYNGSQSLKGVTQTQVHLAESGNVSDMGRSTTRIAILGVSLFPKDVPKINISPSNRQGDFMLAVGSPFGILSPMHFFNSLNLSGSEGGPVFDEQGQLIGIMMRPVRQKSSGAEVQLVIPWEAVVTASSGLLQKEPQISEKVTYYDGGKLDANSRVPDGLVQRLNSCCPSPLPVDKAVASVCLITVDDGVWASGVLLNNQGLILTNAHLLEPWRFRKRNADPFIGGEPGGHKWSSSYTSSRNIRVRLDHRDPWIWCDAKVVYVCKGPLDVALLQLKSVPDQLCPIIMDFSRPPVGSKAYVVGHGLFGPRCGFFPSVCSGVVAKVVEANLPFSYRLSEPGNTEGHFPVMLETTAAVHPGGSGGAVVNSNGHMIGLVTSNARHGGGTVIPHLNFSIPCLALMPIFKFSKDMQDISLLDTLDQPNEHLSSVWALMPPLSPKPPPLPVLPHSLLEDNKNKEAKGSRFAKFIAERQDVLKKPTQFANSATLPNDTVRSKL
ncbi:Glyoxysomal processing protease [Morus notabilis]|uniref:Glyoxysomal processing protease n=1 Tax=Morus notabilis TaxID=981085 RepID=W9RYR5_9ROSA|nr:Glyoxysomal processing protease [Morus notabilis]